MFCFNKGFPKIRYDTIIAKKDLAQFKVERRNMQVRYTDLAALALSEAHSSNEVPINLPLNPPIKRNVRN